MEFSQWEKNLSDLGFGTESIDVKDNFHLFLEAIATNLKQGHLPLIAFSVDVRSGLANPESSVSELTEHAGVITGYNPSSDKITIAHWGNFFEINATDLFHSLNELAETRAPEYYRKNPEYNYATKKYVVKYLPTTEAHAERSSLKPNQGSGFKAKLLIVKQPNNVDEFLHRRSKIEQKGCGLYLKQRLFKSFNNEEDRKFYLEESLYKPVKTNNSDDERKVQHNKPLRPGNSLP